MGFFVHFRGEFECVRCRKTSDAWIQTKLLRTDAENCYRRYQVGDTEVMDGLDDYLPLHTWDGGPSLVVAVGDWECDHCRMGWQWARATFKVLPETRRLPRRPLGMVDSPLTVEVPPIAPHFIVTIRELSTLQPWHPSDLDGVHFVEYDLARMTGLWPWANWFEGRDRWDACSLTERCERVAAGFREWCHEVAGVQEQPRRGERE